MSADKFIEEARRYFDEFGKGCDKSLSLALIKSSLARAGAGYEALDQAGKKTGVEMLGEIKVRGDFRNLAFGETVKRDLALLRESGLYGRKFRKRAKQIFRLAHHFQAG